MKMKRVTILGSGAWAFALSQALKNVEVRMYSIEKEVVNSIQSHKKHPRFPIVSMKNPLEMHEGGDRKCGSFDRVGDITRVQTGDAGS